MTENEIYKPVSPTMHFNEGMLTGASILRAVNRKEILIDPFDEKQLNPNSYNLRLHPSLKVYTSNLIVTEGISKPPMFTVEQNLDVMHVDNFLDSKRENTFYSFTIPEDGYILMPGILYIGRTVEKAGSEMYIPMINGRSSTGRLGLSIHVCAGFGDIGFTGTWTLEMTVVHPLKIYPNMEVAQVSFFTPVGNVDLYRGKYKDQVEATTSKMYEDFNKKD